MDEQSVEGLALQACRAFDAWHQYACHPTSPMQDSHSQALYCRFLTLHRAALEKGN